MPTIAKNALKNNEKPDFHIFMGMQKSGLFVFFTIIN